MKWCNHKLTTFAMVYAATGGVVAASVAAVSSTLPDVLEFRGVIRHRTITHWPYLYLVPAIILISQFREQSAKLAPYIFLFILIGCLCHLAEDALSKTGIPYILPYGPRAGLDLYITGKPSEYFAAMILTGVSTWIAWLNGYVSSDYLVAQGKFFASVWRSLI